MSASLVGSEMCIRDSVLSAGLRWASGCGRDARGKGARMSVSSALVRTRWAVLIIMVVVLFSLPAVGGQELGFRGTD
eukprot:390859-Alexandrium_andersonii.AAC.1